MCTWTVALLVQSAVGVNVRKMLKYSPGDMVRAVTEQEVLNQISLESIKYYAPFYDNNLFNQYGIILHFKNNLAIVRFVNDFQNRIVRGHDLMYIA